ncbi:MAG: hypothetical protein ACFFEF_11140 [Candidatus Thorarchaeota archaeon]
MSISEIWANLYSHNPKIQAFAVSQDGEIVWQTDNWNLVDTVGELFAAYDRGASEVRIAKVSYTIMSATDESLVASSKDKKGHFLMTKADKTVWFLAWITHDSVPELTLVDLKYAATQLAHI